MSFRLLRPDEEADFGEPAHAGEQRKLHVRVAVLDRRVQPAQMVSVGAGDLRRIQGVEDRFVVLVHQHGDTPARALVQRLQQVPETGVRGVVAGRDSRPALDGVELRHHVLAQAFGIAETTAAEAQPYYGMTHGPVPVLVDGKALEQGLVAFEQLVQGVEEQTLAEAPRAGKEVVLPILHHPPRPGRLVDVVVALLADFAERLYPDGQLAFLDGQRSCGTKMSRAGISTAGSDVAFITSSAPMRPFSASIQATRP